MADAFWRYADARQPQIGGKRPRPEYDLPASHDLVNYYGREIDRAVQRPAMRDSETISASYDRYLRTAQISPYSRVEPARPMSGALTGHHIDDSRGVAIADMDPGTNAKVHSMALGSGRAEIPLPHNASGTLYVEGLPADCTRREVSHIFRPFVGYKEVRLVSKESRHAGGDPLILCFVDFASAAHAATALEALQGYRFDEDDRESVNLRLQFARYPGARSVGRYRGKR